MIVLRQANKEVVRIDCSSPAFLQNPTLVRSTTMDQILFQPNCVFKVTLDFKKSLPCVEGTAVRESTDWVLCSCLGQTTHYNKTDETLTMAQCVVTVQSNVDELTTPFSLTLRFDEEEWVVERVFR